MMKSAVAGALAALLVTACSGPATDTPPPNETTGSEESAPRADKDTAKPKSFTVDVLPPIVQPGDKPAAAKEAGSILWLVGKGTKGASDKPTYRITRLEDGEETDDSHEIAGRSKTSWTTLASGSYRITRTDLKEPEATVVRVNDASWQLAFDDEFEGDTLKSHWDVRTAAEQETCSTIIQATDPAQHTRNRNDFSSDLTRVTQGVAVLGVTDRSRSEVCDDGRILRTSGHIGTENSLRIGGARHVIAARIKMPETAGPHTGFWMRGTGPVTKSSTDAVATYEDQAEMDIVESFGRDGTANCRLGGDVKDSDVDWSKSAKLQANFYYNWNPLGGHLHCVPRSQYSEIPGYDGKDYGAWDDYHVYAVDWVPGRYYRVWYDGVLIKTYRGPELSSARTSFIVLSHLISDGPPEYTGPDSQKYIELNGEEYVPGDAFLTPNDLSAMKVDWVRVWSEK